jgi:putative transposase
MTKRITLRLRYYNFLQRLKYKCKLYNKNLYIIDEAYTSKICSNCCNEHENLGSSKIFNCNNCNLKIDRDFNGCRNILLKSFLKKFQVKLT